MKEYTVFETDQFTASQARSYRVPGYLIVATKSQFNRISELTPDQASDLMLCLTRAEALVQQVLQPERIYILKFAEENPRIHFHIFPRTARIGKAYADQVGDQPPYNGARLVDWIWNNHEALGFTDQEISKFLEETQSIQQRSARHLQRRTREE